MQGYEVRTIDDDMIGHVAADDGDFLIVEHGRLMKTKHALPKAFADVDDDEKVVRTTLSKELIDDSPKVNGELDRVARHVPRTAQGAHACLELTIQLVVDRSLSCPCLGRDTRIGN